VYAEYPSYLEINLERGTILEHYRCILNIFKMDERMFFLLSPRYQLFSEATPRKIVGTEGTIKVILIDLY
jgi:hypothetical protein